MNVPVHKILIVDRDIVFMNKVKKIFSRMNLEVQISNTAYHLFTLISTFKPDIILLNKESDSVSSTVIFDELRNNPETSMIQVVQYVRKHGDKRFINIPDSSSYEYAFSEN